MSLARVEMYLLLREEAELDTNELVGWLFEHGLRPTKEGTAGSISAWTELSGPGLASNLQLDEFIHQVDQSDEWYFRLWLPDKHAPIKTIIGNSKSGDGVPEVPNIRISVPKKRFRPAPTAEAAEERANRVVQFMSELADYLSAVYVFGGLAAGEQESGKKNIEKTLEGELSSIYWFNYYSEDLFEDSFKERILSAPADFCKTTPSGSIVLVPHINPIANEEKRGEVIEYLGL